MCYGVGGIALLTVNLILPIPCVLDRVQELQVEMATRTVCV